MPAHGCSHPPAETRLICSTLQPISAVLRHDGTPLSFESRFVQFLAYQLCKSEPP